MKRLRINAERKGVALLAEGVGRNMTKERAEVDCEESPSSRRAWVEISSRLSEAITL